MEHKTASGLSVVKFDTNKHIMMIKEMELSKESTVEILESFGSLLSPSGAVLACLQGSTEAYVVIKEDRVLAAFGLSVTPHRFIPWFLSSGFEKKVPYEFLRASKAIVQQWFRTYNTRVYYNRCLNIPRIRRWLTWLGFSVKRSTDRFTEFYKGVG